MIRDNLALRLVKTVKNKVHCENIINSKINSCSYSKLIEGVIQDLVEFHRHTFLRKQNKSPIIHFKDFVNTGVSH